MSATERALYDFLYALMIRCEKDREWTSAVGLHPLFLRFTLDQGTAFLLLANVKSQLAAVPGAVSYLDEVTRVAAEKAGSEMTFSDAFRYASVEVTKRAKLQGQYWLADTTKTRQAVGYLRRFVDHLVEHMSRMQGGQAGEDGASEQQKLRQLQVGITVALLSWMFLMLAKHLVIYHKLRKVVLEEFGSEHEPTCTITLNTLKKCRYLQWVRYETLRLYSPGPLNSCIAAYDHFTTRWWSRRQVSNCDQGWPDGEYMRVCDAASNRFLGE